MGDSRYKHADAGVVDVLRIARELITQAEHLAHASSGVAKMQSVVLGQAAVELVLMRAHHSIVNDEKKDATIETAERDVLKWTASRGFARPTQMTGLRRARNLAAHQGLGPADGDVGRHLRVAKKIAIGVSKATWGLEFNRLSFADVVSSEPWRKLLVTAHRLLGEPDFEARDEKGTPVSSITAPGQRWWLAASLAHLVWKRSMEKIRWKEGLHPSFDPENYRLGRDEVRPFRDLVDHLSEKSALLKEDSLALSIGISLPDLRRFQGVEHAHLHDFVAPLLLPKNVSTTEEAATFAVQFSTDWVLRVEHHVLLE